MISYNKSIEIYSKLKKNIFLTQYKKIQNSVNMLNSKMENKNYS